MVISINLICCVCVNKKENLKRIVETDENGTNIFDMLSVCTPLQHWSTDFQICQNCLPKLQEAHTFIKQCIYSEELRENLIQELELDVKVDNKWVCQYCNEICATKQSLNRHKLRKHKAQLELQEIFKEKIKTQQETNKTDDNQVTDENKQKFEDEFAENDCHSPDTLIKEELNEIKLEEKDYECRSSDCGDLFANQGPTEIKQENPKTKKSTNSSKTDRTKRHSCEQCGESFTTLASVRRHIGRKHTKSPNDQLEPNKPSDNSTLSQENILEYIQPSLNKPTDKLMSINGRFKCPHCEELFHWKRELSTHKYMSHLAERPFQCKNCIARFSRKASLMIHLKEMHKNKVFVCENCNKRFDSQAKLTYHISTTHSNKREYQCELCGKNYNTKQTLLFHKRVVHTDPSKSPHVCNICSKRFALKNGLENHIKRHMGIKEFICHICSKCFIDNHDLKKHLISHQALEERPSFSCTLCPDKSFRTKDGLKAHLARRHNIGKIYPEYRKKNKYSCTLCPKGFSTKEKLQTHFCSHTGDRPYPCEHCGKGFTDKYNRKKHITEKHQIVQDQLLEVAQEVAVFGKNQFEDDDPVISYVDSKENGGF